MTTTTNKPITPGFNRHMQMALTTQRNGRTVAYYWSGHELLVGTTGFGRWIRTGLEAAKLAIATEMATLVPYVKG